MSKNAVVRALSPLLRDSGRSLVNSTPAADLFPRAKEWNDELRIRNGSAAPSMLSKADVVRRPVPGSVAKDSASGGSDSVDTAPAHRGGNLSPAVSLRSLTSETPPQRNIGLIVLGDAAPSLEALLEEILVVSDSSNITPVFITDLEDTSLFLERGLQFEHVPSRDSTLWFGQSRDQKHSMNRQLEVLKEKWSLDGFVAFGNEGDSSIDPPASDATDLGFWQRQILRLFKTALNHASRELRTEN